MTLIAILFVTGVILLGAEVFIPGGILGVLAVLAMVGGTVLSFVDYGLTGGLLAMGIAIAMVGAVLFFEFAILPKTQLGQRLFLKASIDGTSAPKREREYVGSTGVAVTALGPTGTIEIDGKRHEAFSRSGFLEAGVDVEVVGEDNFRLIVTSKPE